MKLFLCGGGCSSQITTAYKKFEKLLDKYSLEYDIIRYKCIEVCER